MRTTVDIDPHLLQRLRDRAHREGVTFHALLNRILARGLSTPDPDPRPYECPVHPLGAPRTPLNRALAVADLLHDEESAQGPGPRGRPKR